MKGAATPAAPTIYPPPPCGEGPGVGVPAYGRRATQSRTPLTYSPPQGGRESDSKCAA